MMTLPRSNSHGKWGVRLGTLAVWAAAAASAIFWGLRLGAPTGGAAVPAVAAPPPALPDARALARLLGAGPPVDGGAAAPAASQPSRFALVGVLSGLRSGGGAALIAVNGNPAKPFRIGAAVDEGLVLQSLGRRQAQLGPALGEPATVTLEMPLLKR